jgi:endoglucanase
VEFRLHLKIKPDTAAMQNALCMKRKPSWETSATERYVDVSGGWYDAGDYLKFTQTIAYTTYFLLRAYEAYPVNAQASADKKALMDEALWGLNYLLKTMPDDSTFIIQVGNAEDHKQGPRMPYNDALNGSRHAYSDFSPTQMGLTAASLALAAHVFESDLSLKIKARPYRTKAIQIYKKAVTANKVPAWFEEGWEKFYNDATAEDNMELAAIELYRLTQDEIYLNEAKAYAMKAGAAYWYSWGNLNMTAHLRVFQYAPQTVQTYLTTDLNNFNAIASKKGNVWRLPHAYTWASLYSFMGVASSAMIYTHLQEEQTSYNRMGTDVLNYTLGQNNWGTAFIITEKIPGSVKHIYSQMYTLHPELSANGAIAEGPGDKKTHDELLRYFNIPKENPYEAFNTDEVVFYDYNSDFQCMETSIGGMADGIYFFTLINKLHGK